MKAKFRMSSRLPELIGGLILTTIGGVLVMDASNKAGQDAAANMICNTIEKAYGVEKAGDMFAEMSKAADKMMEEDE